MFSRLQGAQDLKDEQAGQLYTLKRNGAVLVVDQPRGPQQYRSELVGYGTEVQQVFRYGHHTVIGGALFQIGDFETRSRMEQTQANFGFGWNIDEHVEDFTTDFHRVSFYGYDQIAIAEPLVLTVGITYDRLQHPRNFRFAPISDSEQTSEQVSPKAGLIVLPTRSTTLRIGYARSLGGISFDQSFRLEPTQVAGFNQSFRSIIPESAALSTIGAEFETVGATIEQKLPTRSYLALGGEILFSRAEQDHGVIEQSAGFFVGPQTYRSTRQVLDYRERTLVAGANQLLGRFWSVGVRYRLSEARLGSVFPDLAPVAAVATSDALANFLRGRTQSTLHEVTLSTTFNHPSGLFSQFQAVWRKQHNRGYEPALPGDDFWQLNLFGGYRFDRRRIELRLGVLNLADQDYRLAPLNLLPDLPRERTFVASLKLAF